jgi:hypothetical protein
MKKIENKVEKNVMKEKGSTTEAVKDSKKEPTTKEVTSKVTHSKITSKVHHNKHNKEVKSSQM